MRHYAFNVGDYAAATAHLSDAEDLAYRRLLDAYYAREAPFPVDVAACCRLVRATTAPARKAVDTVLREFFALGPDGWHQARCDAELARWAEKSEKARESSAIAVKVRQANARHLATERLPNGRPNDAPNGQPSDQPVGHLPTNHEPRTTTTTVPPPSATEPPGEERVARERAPARAKAPVKRPLPHDFAISDRVRAWAADKGHTRLDERLEHFVGKAKANGYRYADWDEAFMTAVRDDWAKLDGKPAGGASRLTPAGQQTANALQRWVETEAKDGTHGP